jgi:3'-phosphoadenosine 5'-phosphosulfate sulfotransferase (PAPS reductase)/FAD synthetase
MRHIVALSGGKDSTALALRLAEVEPREYEYVFTPTGDELPEMIEHWIRLRQLLNAPLHPISCGKSLDGLIRLQMAVPNWRMRWCTRMLKIEPFQAYVAASAPCTVYVGIRADETDREGVAYEQIGGVTRRYPLVEWRWGIGCVLDYLKQRGVEIPGRTDCANCFFQTLYEWWVLWHSHPDRYAQGEAWEELTGHTLRSEQRDSHPAALRELRKEFEAGYVPVKKTMKDRRIMCSVCAR